MPGAINLAQKLATFSEHWSPRTVAEFNGHDVMVVKVEGEFVWHKHDDSDDFFLVLDARSTSNCVTARCGWRRVRCISSPKASNTAPWRGVKPTFC